MKAGYTKAQWQKADDLPVVPYPGVDTKHVQYYLDYASTKEILVEVGLAGKPGVSTRPVTFQLGLEPGAARPLAGRLLDAALDAAGPAGPVALLF